MKPPDPDSCAWSEIFIREARAWPGLAWAEGMSFTLPTETVRRIGLDRRRTARGEIVVTAEVGEPWAQEIDAVRRRAAFTLAAPTSSRLPVSYHWVPGRLRSFIARWIGRRQRNRQDQWAKFPRWPLDLSADFLADLRAEPGGAVFHQPTPVVLSHDLDSPEGLRNLVRDFLPREEARGARSTSFVVPCGWDLDHGLLNEVKQRGHELGIHGYDHGNRTPFAAPPERRRRLDAARPLIERYGMTGYRAPSLLRTRELLTDLASLYHYDASIPTSGGLFPVPNNGCASARPFPLCGILEIPLSLPRDGSLGFLGHTPQEIAALWRSCADCIARSGGVVVLLTHCERRFSGNPAMLAAYEAFLDYLAGDGTFVWTTAEALAKASRLGEVPAALSLGETS